MIEFRKLVVDWVIIEYQIYFNRIQNLGLDEKFYVNFGGCGCFALLMLEIFKERTVKQLEIVFCEPLDKYPPQHVFLSDGEHYYDSRGVHEIKDITNYKSIQIVTEKKLRQSIASKNGWNTQFKRENLGRIRELIIGTVEKVDSAIEILAAVA